MPFGENFERGIVGRNLMELEEPLKC